MEISSKISKLFEAELIDEVYIAYTEFKSVITYLPKTMKLLPIDANDFIDESESSGFMRFEPNEATVLNYMIPKYLATMIYSALSTSAASGQGATMTAMDSATENAENIIDGLTLVKNRARQAAITQEISEIVGGANALE